MSRIFCLALSLILFSKLSADEASMSKIIYLNGPSSSGKTTLAKALQNAFSEPYLHIGIDKLIGFMPANINNWEGGLAPLGFSWKPAIDPTGHPIYEVEAGTFAKKITKTLKDIALLLASQNYNLIIDDVSFGAIEVDEWKQALKNFKVLYVGVTTPLHILEEREKNRGDRFIGGAKGQYFKVHENVAYDVEIDTYSHSLEENVEAIKQALSKKTGLLQTKADNQPGFAVIYRGFIKKGKETEYQNAWKTVSTYFIEQRGAIGSCLHKTNDGMWVAYSRWPDQKTRDASWPGENNPSQEIPLNVREAILTIKNSLDPDQKFPEICMEVVNDLLLK